MSSPILVIGALGNSGTEVIKQLQARGSGIRAADIDANKVKEKFGPAVEAVPFDFLKSETHPAALDSAKRMYLLRPPHIGNVRRDMLPFIDAAKRAGVEQIVFLSILGADKLKVVPHHEVENMLASSGMGYVFLRSAYFMQNLSGIHAAEIRDRNEIFIPAGHGAIGMIDVRDVGAVAAKQFTRVLGRPIQYGDPGIVRFFNHMRRRDLPVGLVIFMLFEYTVTKMGRSGTVTGDVENLLGRKPISLVQFITDHRDAWL